MQDCLSLSKIVAVEAAYRKTKVARRSDTLSKIANCTYFIAFIFSVIPVLFDLSAFQYVVKNYSAPVFGRRQLFWL